MTKEVSRARLPSHEAAIQVILEAIEAAGYSPGDELRWRSNCASSEFYEDGVYTLRAEGAAMRRASSSIFSPNLADKYPISPSKTGW